MKTTRTTATILYSLTLPGALIALLFPGWTAYEVGGFLHIHSFVFHALLVVYVIALLVAKQLQLIPRDLWRSVVFLCIIVPIIYMYNARFQTNFMFLNKPVANTPLQWLYETFGASSYLFSLGGFMLILWLVLYLPFILDKNNK